MKPEINLPAHFHSVLIYGESRQAYGAVKEEDIGTGNVHSFTFDDLGENISDIKTVPWYAAIMPSRMGGQEYTIANDVPIIMLSSALLDAIKTAKRDRIKIYDGILAEDDLPAPDRSVIQTAVNDIKAKYNL